MQSSSLNLKHIRLGNTPWLVESDSPGDVTVPTAWGRKFSRRTLFKFVGSAVPASSTLHVLSQTKQAFQISERNGRIAFLVAGVERWVIDPNFFSGRPKTQLVRSGQQINLGLSGANYPGTSISADFNCELTQTSNHWQMMLNCGFGNFHTTCSFVEWLTGSAVSYGQITVRELIGSTNDRIRLILDGIGTGEFHPGWNWRLQGERVARFVGFDKSIVSDDVNLSLLEPATSSLLASPTEKRSLLVLGRGRRLWTVEFPVTKPQSDHKDEDWHLETTGDFFDRLTIEVAEQADGTAQLAALLDAPGRSTEMRFQPSTHLLAEDDSRFLMPLQNPRLALTDTPNGLETAVVADYSPEVIRAYGPAYTMDFKPLPETPPFELATLGNELENLVFNPGLWQVHTPVSGAITEPCISCRPSHEQNPDLPDSRHSSWQWWRVAFWPPNWGHGLKCLPMSAMPPIKVIRPQDLLIMEFSFENLVLEKARTGKPRLVVPKHSDADGLVKVNFPPQSITEQAFYEYDPSLPITKKRADNSEDPDKTRCSTPTAADCDSPIPPPVAARMSGTSQLVFTLKKGEQLDYSIQGLLDWSKLIPVLASYANGPQTPDELGKTPRIADPRDKFTAIEAPYRLFISPNQSGAWAHKRETTASPENRVELWHTRLGVHNGEKIDENAPDGRTVRAIWSPDYQPGGDRCTWPEDFKPFRMAINRCDRHEIVRLTSDYGIDELDSESKLPKIETQRTAPVQVNRLMLSALGSFLDSRGTWEPPKKMRVEEWVHRSTMARDHYVKVVYKGYLYPLGNRVSLVKVTERKFEKEKAGGYVAYLRQRMFIVIRERVKYYPALGQPFGGRRFPFTRVEFCEKDSITPDLDPPVEIGGDSSLYNFWPKVHNTDFHFNFTVWGHQGPAHLSAPLIFVDNIVAHDERYLKPVILDYQDSRNKPRRDIAAMGQVVTYGPSKRPGDTAFPTERLRLLSDNPIDDLKTRTALARADQPPFYPGLECSAVHITSVEQFTSQPTIRDIQFPAVYLDHEFDPSTNTAEVFAEMLTAADEASADWRSQLFLTFGGPVGNNGDRSGGLSTPNSLVVGLSRKIGLVGGRPPKSGTASNAQGDVTTGPTSPVPPPNPALAGILSGKFNPADFFGGALADAKLLGVVKLSDVVKFIFENAIDNLGDAPQILRKTLFEVEGAAGKAIAAIAQFVSNAASKIEGEISSNSFPRALQQRLQPEWQDLRRALSELTEAAKDLNKPEAREKAAGEVLSAQAHLVQAATTLLDDCKAIAADPLQALGADIKVLTDGLLADDGILAKLAPIINTVNELKAIYEQTNAYVTGFESAVESAFKSAKISSAGKQYLAEVTRELSSLQNRVLATFTSLSQEVSIVLQSIGTADLTRILALIAQFQSDINQLASYFDQLLAAIQTTTSTVGTHLDELLQFSSNLLTTDYQQTRADLESAWHRLPEDQRANSQRAYDKVQSLLRGVQDIVGQGKTYTNQINAGEVEVQQQLLATLDELYHSIPDSAVPATASDVFTLRDRLIGAGKQFTVFGSFISDPSVAQSKLNSLRDDLGGALRDTVNSRVATISTYLAAPVLHNGSLALGDLDFIRDRATYALLLAKAIAQEDINQLQRARTDLTSKLQAYGAIVREAAGHLHDTLVNFQANLPPIFRPAVHTLLDRLIQDLTEFANNTSQLIDLSKILQDLAQLRDQISKLLSNPAEELPKLLNVQTLVEGFLQQCGIPSTVTLSFDWNPPLQDFPPSQPIFQLWDKKANPRPLTIKAEAIVNLRRVEPPVFNITGTLTKFQINVLSQPNFITLIFDQLQFTSQSGGPVHVTSQLKEVKFGEALNFVRELAKVLNPSTGPFLDIQPTGITAGFRLGWPMIPVGALLIYDLRLYAGVTLPFTGEPMRLRFGVSDAAQPFLLQVGVYAGGGFLNLEMDGQGLQRVEGALEFGAHVELDLTVAKGHGHVMAGIYFSSERHIEPSGTTTTRAKLCGFVRAGGELSIIGLISMSLDIFVQVCWQSPNLVYGTATITVEIHMLFFSKSVSVTAEYTFAGSQEGAAQDSRQLAAADVVASDGTSVRTLQPVWAADFNWDMFETAFR